MVNPSGKGLPLPVWGALASSLFMIVGWNWDISWHRSIGRDTVWSLPHISIYVALAIAFLYTAWLVLSHTFGKDRNKPGIRVFGFNGPSGAFVTLWGILLQFMSILFDDWWHGIYGLDIGVFSPPHALLAWGILIFYFGQFILVASYCNTAPAERKSGARWALLFLASVLLAHTSIAADAAYGPAAVRSVEWVISSATSYMVLFMIPIAYFNTRWAGAICAVLYMLGIILVMQIFQLFPATPGFGPVYHRIDNFLPPPFPLFLVVPAFVLSVVYFRRVKGSRLVTHLLLALAFVVSFNVTNWLSSEFMMTEWADNRFFCGTNPGAYYEEHYRPIRALGFDVRSAIVVGIALITSVVMSWAGVSFGRWLRGVIR